MDQSRSEKHESARNSLPDELRPVFDELVEDCQFTTIKRYGQGYVAYIVLADLVRVGCTLPKATFTELQGLDRISVAAPLKPGMTFRPLFTGGTAMCRALLVAALVAAVPAVQKWVLW